jgi:hypothetical protein
MNRITGTGIGLDSAEHGGMQHLSRLSEAGRSPACFLYFARFQCGFHLLLLYMYSFFVLFSRRFWDRGTSSVHAKCVDINFFFSPLLVLVQLWLTHVVF